MCSEASGLMILKLLQLKGSQSRPQIPTLKPCAAGLYLEVHG